MTQPTEQDIQKRFNELPAAVQDAINSWETSQAIQAIGKQYGLHIDQIGELAGETGLLMLGFTPIGAYVDRLMSALRISREDASHITSSINSQVLMPIRKALQAEGGGETPKLPKKDAILESIENPELSAFGDQERIFTSGAKIEPTGDEQTRATILSQIETAGEAPAAPRKEVPLTPTISRTVEVEAPIAPPKNPPQEVPVAEIVQQKTANEMLLPPPEELPELAPHEEIQKNQAPEAGQSSLERKVPIVKIPTFVAPNPPVPSQPAPEVHNRNEAFQAKPTTTRPTLDPIAETYKAPTPVPQTIGIPIKKMPVPGQTYRSDPYRESPR